MNFANKRLVRFNEECIIAGPRTNVNSLYKILTELGCDVVHTAQGVPYDFRDVVLFLRNEGTVSHFPRVYVLRRSWWVYYYKPMAGRKPKYKTYNIPYRQKYIYNHILSLEDVPLLFPE